MSFNLDPKINVNIQGRCVNWLDLNKTYNIIRLQPHKVGTKNVLAQTMLLEPNTKYIVNYNFDLNGETIRVPEDCILEIDGGNISNGILIGNLTILLNPNGVDILQNVTLLGTWKNSVDPINNEDITYSADNKYVFADKYYNAEAFSGLGRIFIRKNIQESVTLEDKFYCVLGADGFRYIFCVYQNEFYYIFNNGAGLVLNRNVVYENLDYRPEYVPIFVNKSLSYQRTQGLLSYDVFMPDGSVKVLGNNDTVIDAYLDGMLDRYVVLKNILEQSVFAYSNTRYILQYDFDINSKTITLPENCYLDFQGGSINSTGLEGTLVSPAGSVTTIISFQEKEEILKNVGLVGEFVFINDSDKKVSKKDVKLEVSKSDVEDSELIRYIQKRKEITIRYGEGEDDFVSFKTLVLEEADNTFTIYWIPVIISDGEEYKLDPITNSGNIEGDEVSFPYIIGNIGYTLTGWTCIKNNHFYQTDSTHTAYTVSREDADENNVIYMKAKFERNAPVIPEAPGDVTMYSFTERVLTGDYTTGGVTTTLPKNTEVSFGWNFRNYKYHYIPRTTRISIVEKIFGKEGDFELGQWDDENKVYKIEGVWEDGVYNIKGRSLDDFTIKYTEYHE